MSFSSRLATIFATSAAAAGAIAAGPPESGFDRPGGVYSNVPAEDAAACAIACAQDKICMSWSFRTPDYVGCSLKAVVPARIADANATSGIADRAADFLSLVAIDPPAAPAPVPEKIHATALTAAPAFSRPVVMSLALAARLPQIAALAAEDEQLALLDRPKSFSLAATSVTPIPHHAPAAIIAAPLSNPTLIVAIEPPAPFQRAAIISAPAPYRAPSIAASNLSALTVILPPEAPQTLAAPASLRAQPAIIRIASRPFASAIASLNSAHPITEIAAPAPLESPRLAPPPAAMAPPLRLAGLGAQVTLAIPPPSANLPSPAAIPAAYAPQAGAGYENAAVSNAGEEELLGAP